MQLGLRIAMNIIVNICNIFVNLLLHYVVSKRTYRLKFCHYLNACGIINIKHVGMFFKKYSGWGTTNFFLEKIFSL